MQPKQVRPKSAMPLQKTQSFKSLEGKKSQISKLICDILFSKQSALKRRKPEVETQVKKRLQESVVSSELKHDIEREAVQLFSSAPSKPQVPKRPEPKQEKPTLDEQHDVVDTDLYDEAEDELRPTCQEKEDVKKQDVQAKITKMNAQLAMEEETKRRQELANRQRLQREELAKQLNEKNTNKRKEKREDQMWFSMELNQMQRQDEIENLNAMARKGKVLEEKQKREKMIAERERVLAQEREFEKKQDEQILQSIHKEIRVEQQRLMDERTKEREKQQLMLEDNQRRLAVLQKREEQTRVEDKRLIREMMENEEKLQRTREMEFNQRLARIQAKMSKMADTVVKNNRDKELKEERRLLALQTEKERQDIEDEKNRKNRIFNQNRMVQNQLKKQMDEKEEETLEDKRKDKELQERTLREVAQQGQAEDSKNAAFTEKVKEVSKFVEQQIQSKEGQKPKPMNETEQKINKDIMGKLEQRNMI